MALPAYTDGMHQTATYWPPTSNDGFGGKTFGSPVIITCRWQDKSELFRDHSGQEVRSSAVVYSDRVLEERGFLALGSFKDAAPVVGSREIRSVGATPSLNADQQLNKVWL